VEYYRSLS
jgi:hypothetical protein